MYDDDNEDYDEYELKAAIKEEHDTLQKTEVFTRVQKSDYTAQQLKRLIELKRDLWRKATRKRSTWTRSTEQHQPAVAAPITLWMLLTLAQLRHHSVHMSDIQSAFLSTPVQPGAMILVKPPPECEMHDDILWSSTSSSLDNEIHHRSFSNTYQPYSNKLVYDS
eukprot:3801657-Amphidinium_carterae.3